MKKYLLYGAAVQGIQGFIFKTNELKDIVGASELVEDICTSLFEKVLYQENPARQTLKEDPQAILHAAGNIKYLFHDEDECRRIVRVFPRTVIEYAPGITVSQAVVQYNESSGFPAAVSELEKRLRAQRNNQMRSLSIGLMGIERSRQTGLPVQYVYKQEHLDASTFAKRWAIKPSLESDGEITRKESTMKLCRKLFLGEEERPESSQKLEARQIAFDVEKMTGQNDWLAIIHADGNGLGQIVMKVGGEQDTFKQFSTQLDRATVQAAHEAYIEVMDRHHLVGKGKIPFRPIVLGGDDLTVICRADLAVDFAKQFIDRFEHYTHEYLEPMITGDDKRPPVFTEGRVRDRLTACAGIVFMKSSFPFYAAYELAEQLCTAAKKDAKRKPAIKEGRELPASCLMFYKIQDSFVESYDQIVERTLTSHEDQRRKLNFGPYYLHREDISDTNRWTIDTITKYVDDLDSTDGSATKSALRKWASLFLSEYEQSQQLKRRMEYIVHSDKMRRLTELATTGFERDSNLLYPAYDILSLFSVKKQNTKE